MNHVCGFRGSFYCCWSFPDKRILNMCWGVGLPSSEKLVNPWGRIRAYSLPNTLPNVLPNVLPEGQILLLRGRPPENPLPPKYTPKYTDFFLFSGGDPLKPPLFIERFGLSLQNFRGRPPKTPFVERFGLSLQIRGRPLETPLPSGGPLFFHFRIDSTIGG